jgi:PREDICTED: similar to kinesin-like protein at 54D CG15844-PA
LSPEANKITELELKQDLLHKYMQQNEGLRAENAQLHSQRERLIHDHERVCRENDRLKGKLPISQNSCLEKYLDECWDLSDEEGKDKEKSGVDKTFKEQDSKIITNGREEKMQMNGQSLKLKSKSLINSISEKFSSKVNGEVKKSNINGKTFPLNLEVRGTSAATKTRLRK